MGGKSRKVCLPAKTCLSQTQQRLLIRAIEHFKLQAYRDGWHTSAGSENKCAIASVEFAHTVEACDQLAELVTLARYAPNHHGIAPRYPYNLGECRGHVAVRVGDIVVDWTVRQFKARAPFPALWLDSESVFGERICVPATHVEFQSDGTTIWVHGTDGATVLRIKTLRGIRTTRSATCKRMYADVIAERPINITLPEESK